MIEKKETKKQSWWTGCIGCLSLFGLLALIWVICKIANPTQPAPPVVSTSSINIAVRSEIIKKIAPNTYRYFFYLDNSGPSSFGQMVEIGLTESNDIQITFDDFTPTPPIPPGQSRFCYLDSKFGPAGSFTSLTITGFKWSIKNSDYQTIVQGSGYITTNYENASD